MNIGNLHIEDDLYAKIRATGSDIIPCAFCGQHLIEIRNVRSKQNYCEDCRRKVSKLSRYESGMYHPNQEERSRIVANMVRA